MSFIEQPSTSNQGGKERPPPSTSLMHATAGGKLPKAQFIPKEKWEPKQLTDKHKTVIALHCQGVDRRTIAQVADCTPEYVSMIVATEAGQAYKREVLEYTKDRLEVLMTKSVDAIERGLNSGDDEVALKAARLQLEAAGQLKQQLRKEESAEDIVATILANAQQVIINNGNLQVNQNAGTPQQAAAAPLAAPAALVEVSQTPAAPPLDD